MSVREGVIKHHLLGQSTKECFWSMSVIPKTLLLGRTYSQLHLNGYHSWIMGTMMLSILLPITLPFCYMPSSGIYQNQNEIYCRVDFYTNEEFEFGA